MTAGMSPVVVIALFVGGDRSLRKVVGLVRPRPQWSKGASDSRAPMKRRRVWSGQ